MKKLLRKYPNTLLVSLAVIFLASIVVSLVWGIGYIVDEVGEANNDHLSANPNSTFNIKAAEALNYRGLIQQ